VTVRRYSIASNVIGNERILLPVAWNTTFTLFCTSGT